MEKRMGNKRADECFKCTSRRCFTRIKTPYDSWGMPGGVVFDEIACRKHVDDLEKHADEVLGDAWRHHLTSGDLVRRVTWGKLSFHERSALGGLPRAGGTGDGEDAVRREGRVHQVDLPFADQ